MSAGPARAGNARGAGAPARADRRAASGSRAVRPADVCAGLLAALEASEGRRRRRARDTTPDAIGLALKRQLLARAVRERPPAGAFEGWLLERTLAGDAAASGGALRAMALEILADWRQARASGAFRRWLRAGAPSDDREPRPA